VPLCQPLAKTLILINLLNMQRFCWQVETKVIKMNAGGGSEELISFPSLTPIL
jgi:hypothetical protein